MDFIIGLPNTSQRHDSMGNRLLIDQDCPFPSRAYYI
jgi:hypothetical protein